MVCAEILKGHVRGVWASCPLPADANRIPRVTGIFCGFLPTSEPFERTLGMTLGDLLKRIAPAVDVREAAGELTQRKPRAATECVARPCQTPP